MAILLLAGLLWAGVCVTRGNRSAERGNRSAEPVSTAPLGTLAAATEASSVQKTPAVRVDGLVPPPDVVDVGEAVDDNEPGAKEESLEAPDQPLPTLRPPQGSGRRNQQHGTGQSGH